MSGRAEMSSSASILLRRELVTSRATEIRDRGQNTHDDTISKCHSPKGCQGEAARILVALQADPD